MDDKTIVIEVSGGCVTRVVDLRSQKENVDYIVRDWDDIKAGDDDPVFQCPKCRKHCATEVEGGSDTPLCDDCWAVYGEDAHGDYWRGYWAGKEGWAQDSVHPSYAKGYENGQAKRGK